MDREVWDLQKKIRTKYPGYIPQPWPEELRQWQDRLKQLEIELSREKLLHPSNPGDVSSDLLPMPPDSGPPLPRALGIKWPWRVNDD